MINFRRLKPKIDFKGFFKSLFFNFLKICIFILIFLFVVPINLLRIINSYYASQIYSSITEVPVTRVAIVFGAGLSSDGTQPSGVLKDRIQAAVDLYKAGKVQKLIMSGDNRFKNYNEPQVMMKYALDLSLIHI